MKQISSLIHAIIIVALICLVAGCAHKNGTEKTAQELAEEGMAQYDKKKYGKAVKTFEQLQDWYPFSKYATLADLKIADAHFGMKEYESAASAYESFERLHPRNEAIPFVIYRIGLCHFNRLDTIDRDQTPALNAIEAFTRLNRQFPENEYAEEVMAHITHCRQSLAAHNLYVGKFYFKSKQYNAALQRFLQITENYQDVGDVESAGKYIEMCREHLSRQQQKAENS